MLASDLGNLGNNSYKLNPALWGKEWKTILQKLNDVLKHLKLAVWHTSLCPLCWFTKIPST